MSNNAARIGFEFLEKIISGELADRKINKISLNGIKKISCIIAAFIIKLGYRSREQSEISRRSYTNLIDIASALNISYPNLYENLLNKLTPDPIGEVKKAAINNLELIRAFSNDFIEDILTTTIMNENNNQQWNDIGETDQSEGRHNRIRQKWKYINIIDFHKEGFFGNDHVEFGNPTTSLLDSLGPLLPHIPPIPPANTCLLKLGDINQKVQKQDKKKRKRALSLEDLLHVQLLLPKIIEQESEIIEPTTNDMVVETSYNKYNLYLQN